MIDIFVYSRLVMEAVASQDVPHLIVSVTTPGDPKIAKLRTNEHTRGVLRLAFDDADRVVPIYPSTLLSGGCTDIRGCILFTDDMAKQVIDFVVGHKLGTDVPRFVVHCDAGRSRSAAIAAALSKVYNGTDKAYFGENTRYTPNMLVYRKVLNAWHAQS